MTNEERQEAIQVSLKTVLAETDCIPANALLTGWCISYEYREGDDATAGWCHGPATLTAWNAIGLMEWARMCVNEGF